MVKHESSLQRTVASFTPLQLTLGIAHGEAAQPWKPISMKLLTNSSCANVASRSSLELGSERYALQHSAVPFGELV